METFENASFLVWAGENGDFGKVNRVTCHRFQSKSDHLSKMADGLVMLRHAQSQVPVVFIVLAWLIWMKIFSLRFRRDENGHFWQRIRVDGLDGA